METHEDLDDSARAESLVSATSIRYLLIIAKHNFAITKVVSFAKGIFIAFKGAYWISSNSSFIQ